MKFSIAAGLVVLSSSLFMLPSFAIPIDAQSRRLGLEVREIVNSDATVDARSLSGEYGLKDIFVRSGSINDLEEIFDRAKTSTPLTTEENQAGGSKSRSATAKIVQGISKIALGATKYAFGSVAKVVTPVLQKTKSAIQSTVHSPMTLSRVEHQGSLTPRDSEGDMD